MHGPMELEWCGNTGMEDGLLLLLARELDEDDDDDDDDEDTERFVGKNSRHRTI